MRGFKKNTRTRGETIKLGKQLGRSVAGSDVSKQKRALVFAFFGNLGAGKTTFLSGFAKGLGVTEKIVSPTFVIMKRFPLHKGFYKNFYHIDCYRLERPKELLALGFKKILRDPRAIIAIEWSERIRKILPRNSVHITLSVANDGKDKRTISISNGNTYFN